MTEAPTSGRTMTPPTIDQSVIERVLVTQADREAAADLIDAYWPHDVPMHKLAQSYRGGHSQGVWAEAFARHRLASLSPSPIAGKEGEPIKCCSEYIAGTRCPACPDRQPTECVATSGEVGKLCEELNDAAPDYPGMGCSALMTQAATLLTQMQARERAMREALQPFVAFARENVDEHGWAKNQCQGERIRDWFGPSEFYRALLTGAGS